jgi:hypothetical protein
MKDIRVGRYKGNKGVKSDCKGYFVVQVTPESAVAKFRAQYPETFTVPGIDQPPSPPTPPLSPTPSFPAVKASLTERQCPATSLLTQKLAVLCQVQVTVLQCSDKTALQSSDKTVLQWYDVLLCHYTVTMYSNGAVR